MIVESDLDLVVIGSGPGGYICAIRAAQLGLSVAVVERDSLGGICLNWGCIPTKALLKSAEVFDYCSRAEEFGVKVGKPVADLPRMVARSRDVSAKLSNGVAGLMKKNKISVLSGEGSFISGGELLIESRSGEKRSVRAKNFVIATGARPRSIPGFEPCGKLIWDYKSAMTANKIPKTLVVVGSGAIGVEFASFYNSIGSQVVLLEGADRIMINEDKDVSKEAHRLFTKKGIKIMCGAQLVSASRNKNDCAVEFTSGGSSYSIDASNVLMAVGVVPNTEGLMLQKAGVSLTNGRVAVDEYCSTGVKNIYAIGDVASTNPCLAHKASHEGVCVAERIAASLGKYDKAKIHPINYRRIPCCVYSNPQVASIGFKESELKDLGVDFRVGYFRQLANGKALSMGEQDGFTKILTDKKTGEVLGAHLIGHEVAELISNFGLIMSGELTDETIISTVFPHPSLSEMLHESALDSLGRVLNM